MTCCLHANCPPPASTLAGTCTCATSLRQKMSSSSTSSARRKSLPWSPWSLRGRTGHGQHERICKATPISLTHTHWSFCPYVLYAPAKLGVPRRARQQATSKLDPSNIMDAPVALPFMLLPSSHSPFTFIVSSHSSLARLSRTRPSHKHVDPCPRLLPPTRVRAQQAPRRYRGDVRAAVRR